MRFLNFLTLITGAFSLVIRQEEEVPCSLLKVATAGQDCAEFAEEAGISLADFFTFNPSIEGCELAAGQAYCVELSTSPIGTMTPEPELTTTPPGNPYTTVVATSRAETTSANPPEPTETRLVYSDVDPDCQQWYHVKQFDGCKAIVDMFGTFTLEDFYKWNPGVGEDCKSLWADYWVCIGVSDTPTPTETYISELPSTPTGPLDPDHSPAMPGVVENCTSWYKIKRDDVCYEISFEFDVTQEDLLEWNEGIDDNCGNLYPGYWMCVGVD